jgi:hypothetical protein
VVASISVYSLFNGRESRRWTVGSLSRKGIKLFYEACFVEVTFGAIAIWLDPFGMLDPQVVVNLLSQLGD